MKIKYLLLLVILSTSILTFAERKDGIVYVEGDYTYKTDDQNETQAQAKQKAVDRAINYALEKHFGTDVSNINSTVIKNSSSGGDTNTEAKFYSMGFSSVKGKWIETIEQDVKGPIPAGDGFLYYYAHVKCKARAKAVADIQIETAVLRNGTDDINASEKFKSDDDFFLYFKSPVEGYVCVYLVDEDEMAYCLLPYQYNTTGYQKVKANEEYIFFSEKYAGVNEQIDEYKMVTNRSAELNQIWIIFSPNPFYKANDNNSRNKFDATIPNNLSYEKLMKWLSYNQTIDEQMIVKRYLIMIFGK